MGNSYSLLIFAVLFTSTQIAWAQAPATDAPNTSDLQDSIASQPDNGMLGADDASAQTKAKVPKESKMTDTNKQSYVTREEFDALVQKYNAKFDEQELNSMEEGAVQEMAIPRLSGFFDTTFSKKWMANDADSGHISHPLFLLQNFNLMLTEHMTDRLTFLGFA